MFVVLFYTYGGHFPPALQLKSENELIIVITKIYENVVAICPPNNEISILYE